MKNYILLLFVFLMVPFITNAQKDSTKVKEKLERAAFESAGLIDNPTNVVFGKNTLEIQMQHRFGVVNSTAGNDLIGFWGAANIRIGVAYSIIDRIAVGFGTTKDKVQQDFNLKGAILQQTISGKVPLSITYYGNVTLDARKPDGRFYYIQHRYSYFNQIIFAKRFSPEFSMQIAPSISHFNKVEEGMDNDMIGLAFGARLKVTPGTSLIIDYSQPLSKFTETNPKPGISLGFEFGTSGHTFQLFATNYWGIVPQQNYMYNQNNFFDGDILIGFNITRNYNF